MKDNFFMNIWMWNKQNTKSETKICVYDKGIFHWISGF